MKFTEEMRAKAAETRKRNAAKRAEERAARLSARLPARDEPLPVEPPRSDLDSPSEPELYDDETEALIAEGLVTRADVERLREEARAQILLERKAAQMKALKAKLVDSERRKAGLVEPKTEHQRWLDELVDVQIRLPALTSAQPGVRITKDPIILDQKVYPDGRNVRVTRAVAMTLYDTMFKADMHAAQSRGQSMAQWTDSHGITMYRGGYAKGHWGA